jgi:hypothetical protein
MNCENGPNTIHLLHQIRRLSGSHLPIGSSFIPYDILLVLFQSSIEGSPISIKVLFANLNHSESGIRYHFDRLIRMGWIELCSCEKDKRVKNCVINEKYKVRVVNYLDEVHRLADQLIVQKQPPSLAGTYG